jgi:hypothetical protein
MNNEKKVKPLTEKKAASREGQGLESGDRSVLIWGIAGTFAVLGLLVYLVVIGPGRRQVRFPSAPTCNVLLITLDTTRADHLGCYGYPLRPRRLISTAWPVRASASLGFIVPRP